MYRVAHLNGDVHRIKIGCHCRTRREAATGFHVNGHLAKGYQRCQREQSKECLHSNCLWCKESTGSVLCVPRHFVETERVSNKVLNS